MAAWRSQAKKLTFLKKFFLKKMKLLLDRGGCFSYAFFRHE
tara:strand:+ start:64 stop:186 length:123 start_codon:yes stop_codon:yes gene_type:complete